MSGRLEGKVAFITGAARGQSRGARGHRRHGVLAGQRGVEKRYGRRDLD
jgi:NAD(P)-dependent dehydrogenase (short-subunit alcohol dehydrogenase family)